MLRTVKTVRVAVETNHSVVTTAAIRICPSPPSGVRTSRELGYSGSYSLWGGAWCFSESPVWNWPRAIILASRSLTWLLKFWKKCFAPLLKFSHYRPGVAQRVGRGIALLFHDRSTRREMNGQQHAPAALYPRKDPVPILQEAGWAPGLVWTSGKSRPHRDSIPDRPARS